MIYELKEEKKAKHLFAGWQDSVVWSAMQGVMGKIYVDSLDNPVSGAVMLGDFCFLSGKPVEEMVRYVPKWCQAKTRILVPQNEEWAKMIEKSYGSLAEKTVRYAIKKEPGIFNLKKLQEAAESLSAEYEMKLIDRELFEKCKNRSWSKDLTGNYDNYELYEEFGLGVAILKDGEMVAGISSYSGYHGGIEIEVVTRRDFRKKGLAYIGGARMILECEKRGLYPNWDAANKMSVGLAEKLGYHFDHEYYVYCVKQQEDMGTMTGFEKLENSLIDVIKEEQAKLGFKEEKIHLYYPLSSLNHFFAACDSADEMAGRFKKMPQELTEKLGEVTVSHKGDRFCFYIPEQGSVYVHENMKENEFIKVLVDLVQQHDCTEEKLNALFKKYWDKIESRPMDNGEFDFWIRFADKADDTYYYCFKDEGFHFIYHRFLPEDYEDFGF